jgi:hypothetical protein
MVKLLMFAARNPHFLRDLRELRVKKTCRPYGGLVNYAEHDFTGSINSNRMIFLAHPRDLTPIESHSSKNRGRGGRRFRNLQVCNTHECPQPQSAHRFTS